MHSFHSTSIQKQTTKPLEWKCWIIFFANMWTGQRLLYAIIYKKKTTKQRDKIKDKSCRCNAQLKKWRWWLALTFGWAARLSKPMHRSDEAAVFRPQLGSAGWLADIVLVNLFVLEALPYQPTTTFISRLCICGLIHLSCLVILTKLNLLMQNILLSSGCLLGTLTF